MALDKVKPYCFKNTFWGKSFYVVTVILLSVYKLRLPDAVLGALGLMG